MSIDKKGQKFLVENITKIFSTGDSYLRVLNDFSMSFDPGILYHISGLSGVGKSTLLHCLALLERPTSGSIWLNGHDLVAAPDAHIIQWRKKHVGMMFQFPYLINELTVFDNIALAGRIAGQSQDEACKQTSTLLNDIGMQATASCFPTQLSGGQQQRVALARALVKQPTLLLADEPTAHLDSKTSACIQEVLYAYTQNQGTITLVASHDVLFCPKKRVRIVRL